MSRSLVCYIVLIVRLPDRRAKFAKQIALNGREFVETPTLKGLPTRLQHLS